MIRSSSLAALAAAIAFPAAAAADSIVFVKGGNVHVYEGNEARAITSGGNWESASQTDDGTIVAVRTSPGASGGHMNRSVIRLTRDGEQIGGPGVPVRPDSSQNGPFDAKVSPDGTRVAFWKLAPTVSDYPIAVLAPTDDPTAYETENFYSLTGHWKPFWASSATAVLFRQQGYPRVSTYTFGDQFSTPWFGNDEQTPTQAGGDISADGTRMVTVLDGAQELWLFELSGPPPAAPTPKCKLSSPAGTFASPTWSPTGTEFAWQDDAGIHVSQIRDWATCDIPNTVVIPGGKQPDWGPFGSAQQTPPADTEVSVDYPNTIKRARLRSKGIPVAVTCPTGCVAKVRLVTGRKVVARSRKTIGVGGTRTLHLKAALPAGVRSLKVKIAAAGDTGTFTVKVRT